MSDARYFGICKGGPFDGSNATKQEPTFTVSEPILRTGLTGKVLVKDAGRYEWAPATLGATTGAGAWLWVKA